MLISANQQKSPLANQDHDWEPVTFVPLSGENGYQQMDAYFEREADKQALADFARIDDDDVLNRLVDAGFTPATLPALQLAPIAFVAWASNSVSDEERRAAVSSIYEARLYEFPAAMCQAQSWLDIRPDQALWDLWVAFTEARLKRTPRAMQNMLGDQLLRQAKAVARASGGFMGLGRICAAEQVVLDGIGNVFDIR